MQISEEEEPLGLRERKRQRTRETIARVALELFDRQGFQETTIAQIAEAADVSPRTVSAYFPHKEDLAFPDVEAEFAAFDARLRDRLAGRDRDRRAARVHPVAAGGGRAARERAPMRAAGSSTPTRACACTSTATWTRVQESHRRRDRARPRRVRRRPRAADGRRGHADRLRAARRARRRRPTRPRRSRSSTARCCSSAAGSALCADEREQARVVLVARRAALEVRAHAGDLLVGGGA